MTQPNYLAKLQHQNYQTNLQNQQYKTKLFALRDTRRPALWLEAGMFDAPGAYQTVLEALGGDWWSVRDFSMSCVSCGWSTLTKQIVCKVLIV